MEYIAPDDQAQAFAEICDSVENSNSRPSKGKVVNIFAVTDLNDLSREQLAMRVGQCRDKQAFALLFSYYAPRIKSYLLKHNINSDLAEDLAQETMVIFWRKAEQYDLKKAKFSTWLYRIARNKLIDHKRKFKYPEVNADDQLVQLPSNEETDAPAIAHQNGDLVREAIKTLSAPQRLTIELSYFEDASHAEISRRLSVPLGTVKSRIRLAFNALRKELGAMK